MSDLRKKIIQKMQEGGSITYRGAFGYSPDRFMYQPHLRNPSRGTSGGRGYGGSGGRGSSKSKSKSEGENEGGDMYHAHASVVDGLTAQMEAEMASVPTNPAFVDDPAMQIDAITKIHTKYDPLITAATRKGTQVKESWANWDKSGSRSEELSDEWVVQFEGDGTKPNVLVQSAEGGYGFVNAAQAYQAQEKGWVNILRVSDTVDAIKNDDVFAQYMDQSGVDFYTLINGLASATQLEKHTTDFMKNANLQKDEKQGGFTIGNGDHFIDAGNMLEQANKGEVTELTEFYLKALDPKMRARLQVGALADRGVEGQFDYMNEFTLAHAPINLDKLSKVTSSLDNTNSDFSALVGAFTGSSAQERSAQLSHGIPADAKKKSQVSAAQSKINVIRKETSLPSAKKAMTFNNPLILGTQYADVHGVGILQAGSVTGQVSDNMELAGAGVEMEELLHVSMGGDPRSKNDAGNLAAVQASTESIKIRTDKGIVITSGYGLEGGHGRTNHDLELLMAEVAVMVQGSVEVVGQKYKGGLEAAWAKEFLAATGTQADFDKSQAAVRASVFQVWTTTGRKDPITNVTTVLSEAEAKAQLQKDDINKYKNKYESYIQTRFEEEVVNGDALKYHLAKGVEGSGKAAKLKAIDALVENVYKPMLQNDSAVVVPVAEYQVDVAIQGDASIAYIRKLVKEGIISGSIKEVEAVPGFKTIFGIEDPWFWPQIDDPIVLTTTVQTDIGTDKLTSSVLYSEDQSLNSAQWTPDSPEFKQLLQDFEKLYTKTSSLRKYQTYQGK